MQKQKVLHYFKWLGNKNPCKLSLSVDTLLLKQFQLSLNTLELKTWPNKWNEIENGQNLKIVKI